MTLDGVLYASASHQSTISSNFSKAKTKKAIISANDHIILAFLCVETRIANFEFVFASTKYVIDEEARAKLPKKYQQKNNNKKAKC